MNFQDFEALLWTYPACKIEQYQKAYTLKASLLGKIASERLVEQEEATKKLSKESRKPKCDFNLAQAANLDLEKKVAELANALKKCQDEKKIVEDGKKVAEETLKNSRKELEKLQKTHDEDLKLIKNIRKDHDKSSKAAEDLRVNNADLAKTLSSKEQQIQVLEKALADRDETSEQEINNVKTKLKLLFEEYGEVLKDFGARLGPLPEDGEISSPLSWVEEEFQALSGVISGTSDFAATFSVESILKLLHDFDCADLLKFRETLACFPDVGNTSRIRPNEDVQIIKARFTQEFWFASGKEFVKKIARAKLEKVEPLRDVSYIMNISKLTFLCFVFFQLIQEEMRGKSAEIPESSSEDEEEDAAEKEDGDSSRSDEDNSSSSGSDADTGARANSEHKDSSPKVDIVN
jgi:hypothetical protein